MREDIRELIDAIGTLKENQRRGLAVDDLAADTEHALDVVLNVVKNLAEELERLDGKVDQNFRMTRQRYG